MGVFTSNSTTYYDNSGCYGKTMQIVHRHKHQVWYGVNYIDLDMPSSILYKNYKKLYHEKVVLH